MEIKNKYSLWLSPVCDSLINILHAFSGTRSAMESRGYLTTVCRLVMVEVKRDTN